MQSKTCTVCTQGMAGTGGGEDEAADLAALARGDVPDTAASAAPATDADALLPGDFLDADDVYEVLLAIALPFAMMCRSGPPSLLALHRNPKKPGRWSSGERSRSH